MTKFNYSLDQNNYTVKNMLFWGVCLGHWQKVKAGTLGHRFVHAMIAALQVSPIFGQIFSLAEGLIVTYFGDKTTVDITQKKISQIKDEKSVSKPILPRVKSAVDQTSSMSKKESIKEPELKPVKKIAEEPTAKPTVET